MREELLDPSALTEDEDVEPDVLDDDHGLRPARPHADAGGRHRFRPHQPAGRLIDDPEPQLSGLG